MESQESLTLLQNAIIAYQNNDRLNARHYASEAIRQNPMQEDAWLILAAISTPSGSLAYMQKAYTLFPDSQRTQQALAWAENRSKKQKTLPDGSIASPSLPTNDHRKPVVQPGVQPNLTKNNPRRVKSAFTWILLFLFLTVIGLAVISPNWHPARVLAFFSIESVLPRPEGIYLKPTRTPTVTNTATPTFTTTPTLTFTPSPTDTPTPTLTPQPTGTPSAVPTAQNSPVGLDGDEFWMEVDLSEQMMYAYEGETLVNQFLVSTGTYYTPTVEGQFAVYVKYTAADMSGPGYYLPSVPYVMYFYKDYGIHAATWHNNFGTPMSHGCINMRVEDAEWVFNRSSIGTEVIIHE